MKPEFYNQTGAGKLFLAILLIVIVILVVTVQLGCMFLLLALLPSIVAYYIDQEKNHAIFKTVFACNLAGTLPSVAAMFKSGVHSQDNVVTLMSDTNVWLYVYSGAAIGWCLIFLFRFAARFFTLLAYNGRIAGLVKRQERLVAEWGEKLRTRSE